MCRYVLGSDCLGCGLAGRGDWCNDCQQALVVVGKHCPTCARAVADERYLCGACLRVTGALDRVFVAYRYREPLRGLVLQAKYSSHRGALQCLSGLLLDGLPTEPVGEVIVPVPMSPRRLAQRGFNQTHFLARAVARRLERPLVKDCLQKIAREPQSLLKTHGARRRNIKGAFVTKYPLINKKVLLVDDIMTSGATGQEAARVLKAGGAAWVGLVVVAAL